MCVEALAEALGHAKPVVRGNAAQAISLRALREPRLDAPMTAAVQDVEGDVRRSAAKWLAKRPDEKVAPALMAALRDTDSEVRSENYGPYNARPNVALMNTPICSRVTGAVGQ